MATELDALKDMRARFDRLADALRRASRGREVVLLLNDGNYGDALIRYGTEKFLEDIGVPYVTRDMGRRGDKLLSICEAAMANVTGRRLFVYSGSGAWSRACDLGYRNVRRLTRFTDDVFVLPTTFEDLAPEGLVAFARDRFESQRCAPEAPFCDDMAFYLSLIPIERVAPSRPSSRQPIAFMFRTDNETNNASLATLAGSVDLSTQGNHLSDPAEFLRRLDEYEHIVTDRLHVAVGGAIMGRRVSLLAGSYFKIRAIYLSSMADAFPKVAMFETADDLERAVPEFAAVRRGEGPALTAAGGRR